MGVHKEEAWSLNSHMFTPPTFSPSPFHSDLHNASLTFKAKEH